MSNRVYIKLVLDKMADALIASAPGLGMIGKEVQQGQDYGCFPGKPTETAAGVRLFGQPHISKAQNGGASALPPSNGAYNFAYNWGAANSLSLSGRTDHCPLSNFDANHRKPDYLRNMGPNNVANAGNTVVPREAYDLFQKDARIERGNVATDVNLQPRYLPTQRGAPTTTTFWGQDVYTQKQRRALNSYKEVNAKLRALRAATQQSC